MSQSVPASAPAPTTPRRRMRRRLRNGLIVTLLGELIFLLGAKPEWFGADRSPVVGFVQISVFLVGLAFIALGGYVALAALWGSRPRSIAADLGLRLISTGYVIAVFAGMADVFGLGTQPVGSRIPAFGPLQAIGVLIGQALIASGFLLMIPYDWRKSPESPAPDAG